MRPPKGTTLNETTLFEPLTAKNQFSGLGCRLVEDYYKKK